MTAGVLPSEIFERIFDFVRAIEEREAEEERKYIKDEYCRCDCCGDAMTHQEYDHMEQTAKDEIDDENIDHVKPEWTYCGVVCRERLAGYCDECCECGDMCHLDYGDGNYFQYASRDDDRKERMGWHEENYVCVECVENWDSGEEDED